MSWIPVTPSSRSCASAGAPRAAAARSSSPGTPRGCAQRLAESRARWRAPRSHSSPSTGAAHVSPASDSARALARCSVRSQRESSTGVAGVIESISARSGRKRRADRSPRRQRRCYPPPILVGAPVAAGDPGALRQPVARLAHARAKARGSATSSRLTPSSSAPAWLKCVWLSMKPGVTSRPPASTIRVCDGPVPLRHLRATHGQDAATAPQLGGQSDGRWVASAPARGAPDASYPLRHGGGEGRF
jgi:hypothetical protein